VRQDNLQTHANGDAYHRDNGGLDREARRHYPALEPERPQQIGVLRARHHTADQITPSVATPPTDPAAAPQVLIDVVSY
jgi:hypothetical protein